MKKFNHIATLVLLCLVITSCFARNKPYYDLTVSYDESAPPEWKLGWQHGCESGISAWGSNYYKSLYKFKQDVSMVKNEYYFKAWTDAYSYCRSVINRGLAGDEKAYEEVPTLISTHNLDITTSRKRDDPPINKNGIFFGKDNLGLFGTTFEAYAPGYGSMAWGSQVKGCDWLNRCGADKPKDPMDALMGQ